VTATADTTTAGKLATRIPVVPKPNARIFPVNNGPVIAPKRPKEIALPMPVTLPAPEGFVAQRFKIKATLS